MAGVVLFVVALAISALLGNLLLGYIDLRVSRRSAQSRADIREQFALSELRVDAEFANARASMNDAAGQSWRNLAG